MKKVWIWILAVMLLIASYSMIENKIMITSANPDHINVAYENNTYLNVTVQAGPATINSYDLQVASTSVSKRNDMIDVGTEYKFVVNVTCPNTWQEIDYINITAWYDDGNESSYYNQTPGGNLNLFLQYKNTTGTAEYNMLWPDDEVTKGTMTETVINETTHIVELSFTPGYQFRSAPGDGTWGTATNTTDDLYSWNFKIEVTTSSGNVTWVKDEFGVYRYCELSVSSSVSASALPGHRASTSSGALTITYKVNAPYKLNVTTNETLERVGGGDSISRSYINVTGGDITGEDSLNDGVAYIKGSETSYHDIHNDGTQESINDVQYHCDIPFGTLSGVYSSKLYYTLSLETS